MPRIPIAAGAYQSRSIISGGQRQVNLYHEANEDPQAPSPVTLFPTAGQVLMGTPPVAGAGRCGYRASNGDLFEVVDTSVYFIDTNFAYHLLGQISAGVTPAVMKDNGLVAVVVSGILNTGWAIDLATHAFGQISDGAFFGGTYVDYVDTFFVFNTPGINQWQISLALVTFDNLVNGVVSSGAIYAAFDPQDVAAKSGSPDRIAGVAVMHRNLWTVGTLASEVWYNSGAADFTFATIPGVYIEYGTIADYSIAHSETNIFWLSQNRDGARQVMMGTADFKVKPISAKGLEAIIGKFARVDDAVSGTYQQLGHTYYVIVFPSEGRSFEVEITSGQWLELAYSGPNGLERYRGIQWCFAYRMNLITDFANGNVYKLDPTVFTDNGNPVTRLRTIPHILADGKRIRIDRLIADLQGGTLANTQPPPYATSIQQVIAAQGLTGGLKLLLEAGALPSWSGAGQKWMDESGGGYDFFLGLDGAVAAQDPTFNGSPGGQSLNEYWQFNGSQFFTYDSANEPWMNAIHQAGAQFTILAGYYVTPAPGLLQALIGDDNGGGPTVGFIFYYDTNNTRLVFQVGNGSAFLITPVINGVAPNALHISGVSLNAVGGPSAGFMFNDGLVAQFNPAYTAPSAGPAVGTLAIGSAGGGSDNIGVGAGARLQWIAVWQGVNLTQAQVTALYAAIQANNALPSPLLASPEAFLRVSTDRGGSWSDALPCTMGDTGEYGVLPYWTNLGTARDWVFEVSWSAPIDTAFNGVFVEATPASS